MKRGQATIFIILGIVIAAGVIAAVWFKGDVMKERLLGVTKAAVYPENVQLLKDEVDSCYVSTVQEGVKLLGRQGGYIFPPEADSMVAGEYIVSFAYDKKAKVPAIETMEQELAEYVDIMLPLCPEYELYENLNIEESTPKTTVTVKEDKVNFETTYILSLISGQDTFQISEPYTTSLDVGLGKMQELTSEIVTNAAKKSGAIDPEFLLTLGMPIEVVPYSDAIAVYLISDPNSNLPTGEEAFVYMFATRK